MSVITITGNIVITDGLRIPLNQKIDVEAYDKFDILVPKPPPGETAGFQEVDISPGDTSMLKFVLISCKNNTPGLKYRIEPPPVGSQPDTGETFILDGPHVLIGQGATALLFSKTSNALYFQNTASEDANIQILIGRDATP